MQNMKNDGMRAVQGSVLALALCFMQVSASDAQEPTANGAEFLATINLHNFFGRDNFIEVGVDCDLLGPEGQKTLEFVKQFGIWGHITHETDIGRAERHLRNHGITPDKIENVRQYCIDNYL